MKKIISFSVSIGGSKYEDMSFEYDTEHFFNSESDVLKYYSYLNNSIAIELNGNYIDNYSKLCGIFDLNKIDKALVRVVWDIMSSKWKFNKILEGYATNAYIETFDDLKEL